MKVEVIRLEKKKIEAKRAFFLFNYKIYFNLISRRKKTV
jgi:hypothetical protein